MSQSIDSRTWRTVSEAAKLLGVSSATLRNWDKAGTLKAERHPANRYRVYSLDRLLSFVPSLPPAEAEKFTRTITHTSSPRRPSIEPDYLGQHMTPASIADEMIGMINRPATEWRAIDPACGDGNLLLAVVLAMKAAGVADIDKRIAGVDVDPQMVRLARTRLSAELGVAPDKIAIHQANFLEEAEPSMFRKGLFDLYNFNVVISNPPYGKNLELKFFQLCDLHSAPGAELVFLMPLSFLDRANSVTARPLKGRPMGVTTGHAIVYHRSRTPFTVAPPKGSQTNQSEFTVCPGVKLYEVGAGLPPQTKAILEQKPFSSASARDGWVPCLRTGDVQPYSVTLGRLYVDYGPHLANPQEPELFKGPKIIVRRVPMWDTKCLACAYTENDVIAAGDLLVVRHKGDDSRMLQGLCVFLNSPVAAKTLQAQRPSLSLRDSFPKIAAKDINYLLDHALPDERTLSDLATSYATRVPHSRPETASPANAKLAKARAQAPLIVGHFPFAEISAHASKEKSVRQGHISTLQMWWARRPLAVCRATILASLLPNPDVCTDKRMLEKLSEFLPGEGSLTSRMLGFISRVSAWEAGDDPALVQKMRQVLAIAGREHAAFADTFAGGGSLPLEALRLGLQTYASDINPVSVAILKATLEQLPGSRPKLLKAFLALCDSVELETKTSLATNFDFSDGEPTAYFWCRTFVCAHCKAISPLYKDRFLAKGKRPVIFSIDRLDGRICSTVHENPTASEVEAANTGTLNGKVAICIHCKAANKTSHLMAEGQGGRLSEWLFAKRVQVENNRASYVACSAAEAERASAVSRADHALANVPLNVNGIRHTWAQQYGVASVPDLFNNRQLQSVSALIRAVKTHTVALSKSEGLTVEEEMALATLGAFLVNRLLGYSNRHSWWQSKGEFPAHIFGRQAIPFVANYVEIPPFSQLASGIKSAGKWIEKTVRRLVRIDGRGKVANCDAAATPWDKHAIDLVVIDPPYFDAIGYSYLSDVFLAATKPILQNYYGSVFQVTESPKGEEAIVDRKHKAAIAAKAPSHFERKMKEAFVEIRRLLKQDGLMVVMFGHQELNAWTTLFAALKTAGMSPLQCWPMHMERGSKFRHGKVDSIATASLIVCQPLIHPSDKTVDNVAFQKLLKDDLFSIAAVHGSVHSRGVDLRAALFAPAMSFALKFKEVVDAKSGEALAEIDIMEIVSRTIEATAKS